MKLMSSLNNSEFIYDETWLANTYKASPGQETNFPLTIFFIAYRPHKQKFFRPSNPA